MTTIQRHNNRSQPAKYTDNQMLTAVIFYGETKYLVGSRCLLLTAVNRQIVVDLRNADQKKQERCSYFGTQLSENKLRMTPH
jgi:hypothetical protein